MPSKKPDPATAPPEQQDLERRVDAMMNVESQSTAPPLPPELLKTIGGAKPAKVKSRKAAAPAASAVAEPPATEVPSPEPAIEELDDDSVLQSNETDQAVDDIVAHEADTQLAVDDALGRRRTAEAESSQHRPSLLAAFFTSPWTWLIIIGTVSVLYLWYR